MKHEWRNITIGLLTAVALTACGGGSSSGGGGGNPGATTEEWVILATDTANGITAFKGSASSPIQTITQLGQTVTIGAGNPNVGLGEIHFANGKAFITITSGLTGPDQGLVSGGLAVYNLDTQQVEKTVILESTATGRKSRAVHVYLDPEAKYLWVNNDGPSGNDPDPAIAATASAPDSVFRVNVDPTDTANYLTFTEVVVGNGHKKSAFSRPSTNQPTARNFFFTSSLTERRIDVIDEEAAVVVKTIRNVGASPHGMDYSPNSGRVFAGITGVAGGVVVGGGMVSIDATQLDLDKTDVDCANISDNYCVESGTTTPDLSVYKLSTGPANNPNLLAGYVHVHTNALGEDTVYTSGYFGGAGFLTPINPGAGNTPPSVETAIELGDMAPSSFDFSGDRIYVPSGGNNVTITNQVKVVDANLNTVVDSITIGAHSGENRNGEASPDGRLIVYPNTAGNTVSVIDTEENNTVHTVTLPGPARSVAVVHLPVDAEDNH